MLSNRVMGIETRIRPLLQTLQAGMFTHKPPVSFLVGYAGWIRKLALYLLELGKPYINIFFVYHEASIGGH